MSQVQISGSLAASLRAGVVTDSVVEEVSVDETEKSGFGPGLRQTRVMERPASWRASINEVNISPVTSVATLRICERLHLG